MAVTSRSINRSCTDAICIGEDTQEGSRQVQEVVRKTGAKAARTARRHYREDR